MTAKTQGIAIIPGWVSPTHSAVHHATCDKLGYAHLSYSEIILECKEREHYLMRLYSWLWSFIHLIKWRLLDNRRRGIFFEGVELSHGIIDWAVRSSEIGKKPDTLHFLVELSSSVRQAIILRKLLREYDVKLVIGGDESYGFSSILLQQSHDIGIKIIHFKEIRRKVYCFSFNRALLYSGPDYTVVYDNTKPNKDEISTALNEINSRVDGDSKALTYMRDSVYSDEKLELPELFGVLFLHDFVDSPGIYGENIFQDQWDWISETVDICRLHSCKLIIKQHPNAHDRNAVPLKLLRQKYIGDDIVEIPDFSFSVKSVRRAKFFATMFGSVVEEAFAMGIPVITTSNHPFRAQGLSIEAESVSAFRHAISQSISQRIAIKELQERGRVLAKARRNLEGLLNSYFVGDFSFDDLSVEDREIFEATRKEGFGINERREFLLSLVKGDENWNRLYNATFQKASEIDLSTFLA